MNSQEGSHEEENWKISYTGFLEKRNLLNVWKYHWVVLENHKLFLYENETERLLKEKFFLTSTTIVEAISSDSHHPYLFHVYNSSSNDPSTSNSTTNDLILSAVDFSSLEAWMIALIQCINGSYRPSENFCSSYTNPSADARSSLILPSFGGMNERFSKSINCRDPEKSGYLYKQGSEFKTWRKRWFHLKHNHFRYYETAEAENLKGVKFIDNESKVILLPTGFDGQMYGFSLITLDSVSGEFCSLRMSATTEDEMFEWISALRSAIRRYTEDQYSIPLTEQEDDQSSQISEDEEDRELLRRDNRMPAEDTLSNKFIDCPLIRVSPEESLAAIMSETGPPRSYYLNDNTMWAKIQRKLSPGIHTTTNDDLQRLYLLHFCALIPGSNYIVVEVFEHQRYIPLKGWSPLNLLFSDCSKLSNCIGIKYPDRYLKRADPPLDYRWVEEKPLADYDINLLDHGILTPWKWTVCRAFTPDGEKAWCYGTSFEDIRRKYEIPELRTQSHTCQRTTDVVRRRRWIRLAVEKNST